MRNRNPTRPFFLLLAGLLGFAACSDRSTMPSAPDESAAPPTVRTVTSSGGSYELIQLGGEASQAVELNGTGIVVGAATNVDQQAVYWTVDEAGSVTGPTALGIPGDDIEGWALGVNDAGHVIAFDRNSYRGFIYDIATAALTELSSPEGAVGVTPRSINAGDVVAGNAVFDVDGSTDYRPVVWTDPLDTSVAPTLLPLPADHHYACALPVPLNDEGVIVGYSGTEDETCRLVRWRLMSDGSVSDPELFGPTDFFGRHMNDAGRLAGSTGSDPSLQAVLLEPDGSTVALDPVAGDPQAAAIGIDDPASDRPFQVAGSSDIWGETEKAVVWTFGSDGTPSDPVVLPVEDCGASSRARAINAQGWVVGWIVSPTSGKSVATLWRSVSDGGAGDGCAGTSHIGDLDGSTGAQGGTWTAFVDALVLDDAGNPVADATVSGSWSGGVSASGSCDTAADGRCTVSLDGLPKRNKSVTYTVEDVAHADLAYDAAANTDPDGDSDGTSITVSEGDTDDGGGNDDGSGDDGDDCVPRGNGNNCK